MESTQGLPVSRVTQEVLNLTVELMEGGNLSKFV